MRVEVQKDDEAYVRQYEGMELMTLQRQPGGEVNIVLTDGDGAEEWLRVSDIRSFTARCEA